MKKTLIALAAVALTGAAFAQSSVTLSGKVNIGLQKTGDAKTTLAGGADGSDSRLIFAGTEDLGGGLKARFHLEQGFKPDTGALDNTANKQFQRQAYLALGGGFGEVRLGRQYTLGFFGTIANMPSTYTDPLLGAGLNFNGVASRNDDQIQYWSPRMGGVQARVSTQLKGDAVNATTELALNYAGGPIAANLTTAKTKNVSGNKLGLDVSYNFGMATVAAGYVDTDSAAGKGYVLRAVVPLGAVSAHIGYASNSDTDVNAYNVGAFYSLSKRTRVYALYGAGNKTVTNKVALGLDHNF